MAKYFIHNGEQDSIIAELPAGYTVLDVNSAERSAAIDPLENVDVIVPQFPGFFSMNMLNDLDASMLEKSVNMYLGRMMFRRLSSINQAYYLGHSQYFDGDLNSDSEFLDGLKAVTLVDVNRVAKKYMDGQNPISIIVR